MTDAQTALVLAHDRLVRLTLWPVIKRIHSGYIEPHDVLQAGRVGLCEAAMRWDESTGVPFKLYARRRIHGAGIDAVRRAQLVAGLPRRGGGWAAAPMVQLGDRDDWGMATAYSQELDHPILSAQLETVIARFPDPRHRVVLRAFACDVPQDVTARALGLSSSRVSQLTKAALARLRKEIHTAALHASPPIP